MFLSKIRSLFLSHLLFFVYRSESSTQAKIFPDQQISFLSEHNICSNPMAEMDSSSPYSFADFPEDVLLCILSFLHPIEISNFASTSKRFVPICHPESKLWYALCDRRWGSKTQIRKWGNGKISYKLLYKTLNKWENLIGFWRRCGQSQQKVNAGLPKPPGLVFFEWGPSFVRGSRVSPSENGTYSVIKSAFIFMGISTEGQILNYLDPEGKSENWIPGGLNGESESDLVNVNVNFIGDVHFSLEEEDGNRRRSSSGEESGEDAGLESGSPTGSLPEMYQYYANRSSPVGERSLRRQRRREKQRQVRKRWETEHYLKIVDCSPTPSRPLQGLWKGLCDEMKLEFYLVEYDGVGISCRRLGDLSERLTSCMPVFWTSNPTFIDSPFSPEELKVFDTRIHIRPPPDETYINGIGVDDEVVVRVMYINSSFDLVIPGLEGSAANPWRVEGRIWQYKSEAFGFGFLRDNFIVDMKHIARDASLLDAIGPS
ncbi:F-box protein At3g12350 [Linum grandiflorum]